MPIISQFFSTTEDARKAVSDLKEYGLRDAAVQIVDRSGGYVGPEGLVRKGLPKASAQSYAADVREGRTLLIVDAPYGGVGVATEIMERHAGAKGGSEPTYESAVWEDAAPLSSALQLPVLSKSSFSSFWGAPVLLKSKPTKVLGLPLLSKSKPSASLIKNPAPLSSLFHIPTLRSGR
jgi:hypothetical protein